MEKNTVNSILTSYKFEKVVYKGRLYNSQNWNFPNSFKHSISDRYSIICSKEFFPYKDIKTNPKSFFDSVQSKNDFKIIAVDGFIPEIYNLSNSYEDFLILLEKRRNIKGDDFCIYLHHQLQPNEAESYYVASMSLVINENEFDNFYDGMQRVPPLPFEVTDFIHLEGNYGKIFDIVPEHDRIDFPLLQHENTKVSRTFISKKCIDKALLYKLYKDPATIGTPKSSRAYTGKVEIVELDMHHLDEQVLDVFIQHGVIRKQEPISETEAEQMIAHAKSEAEKSAQDYKEWLLQQQNK